jgi:hypothetical protein
MKRLVFQHLVALTPNWKMIWTIDFSFFHNIPRSADLHHSQQHLKYQVNSTPNFEEHKKNH